MTMRQQTGVGLDPSQGRLTLLIKGWQPRYREALAVLLSRRQQLGSALLTIRFEPGGSLWLDTTSLGAVRFGPLDQRLPQRIEVLEHLLKELPSRLQGRRLQAIDLSDPDQPELALPGPLKPLKPQQARP
jgi:cell division protein FtsQ